MPTSFSAWTTRASRSASARLGSCTLETLRDDVADHHARAERIEGILEDDLHVAAKRPHLLELRALDVAAEEDDAPLRRDQPEQRQPERRLAGAGFADDAERLPLAHHDVDPVDRLDVADGAAEEPALDREPDLQVVGAARRPWRVELLFGGLPFGSAASRCLRVGMLRVARTPPRSAPARRSRPRS